jgi:hypothetical protein
MATKKLDREESDEIFTLQTNAEGGVSKFRRIALPPEGSYETVGARLEIRSDLFSLNQRRLFKEFGTGIQNTRRPRLFDDRSRIQDMKDRPMFFPTNSVWFRRSSYSDPLAGDARRLAPLGKWSEPPGGRPGVNDKRVLQPQQSRLRSQEPPDTWCDAQNVIDGPRHKKKFPTEDQPRTWERYEPSSKGMDQNEHCTRRHKYEIDPPPSLRRRSEKCGRTEEHLPTEEREPAFPFLSKLHMIVKALTLNCLKRSHDIMYPFSSDL